MIPYSRQYIDEEDIKAVAAALRADWITQGPKIAEFEKKVADYCAAKFAVAVSSGTAALHLACLAAGIAHCDEVITSPITFVASANCALYVGAKPVFADILPDTYCIDPASVRDHISARTRGIIAVDFAGHPCDMERVREIAEDKNIVVIEDAAHSLGADYNGRKVGSLADMTTFSFHPVKHITTGEGGMIVTNDQRYYERLLLLRTHGITRDRGQFLHRENVHMPWYYEMQTLGFNYRITDFQCALGIRQMDKLDDCIRKRRAVAAAYDRAFQEIDEIITPAELSGCRSAYHLYPIQLKTRDRNSVFAALREKGIGVNVHYIPVYLQPYYQKTFAYRESDFPVAGGYFRRCISLPVHQGMTTEEIGYIIDAVLASVEAIDR